MAEVETVGVGHEFRRAGSARDRLLPSAVAAAVLLAGCVPTLRLSQLPPAEQVTFQATDPGWHSLSPYFAVDIKSSQRGTFYYFSEPGNAKTKTDLGSQYFYWPNAEWQKRKFGPRANAYVVSADGRALLYFTEPRVLFSDPHSEFEPKAFGAELHLYRHGQGDSLIVKDVSHWYWWFARTPMPADAVFYTLPDKQGLPRIAWRIGTQVARSIGEFVPQ